MPDEPFQIITVPDDAGERVEAMGTKPKFWYEHPELGRCLYKEARPGTGEDWAEKVAAELARLLNLPHAVIELAEWKNTHGTISPLFVHSGEALVHGNEMLFNLVPSYPSPDGGPFYSVSEHTIAAVRSVLEFVKPPVRWHGERGIQNGWEVFVGYLMLDALIGNTDRHHENWGVVGIQESGRTMSLHITPTYDHASSLGREMKDAARLDRLTTKDAQRSVRAYVEKARSALYCKQNDVKPMGTLDAFLEAARSTPQVADVWRNRLRDLPSGSLATVVDRIPDALISKEAGEFALAVLKENQRRILAP